MPEGTDKQNRGRAMSPSSDTKQYSRSYNADAALPLRVA